MPRMRTFSGISVTVSVGLLVAACGGGNSDPSGAGGTSASSSTSASSTSGSGSGSTSGSGSGGAGGQGSGETDPLANIGKVEQLSTGYLFTEGPLWRDDLGALLFSDVQGNTIYKITPPATAGEVFRTPSNNANGLALDPEGRLLTCEHSGRRVSRTEGTTVVPLADLFEGKKLNSPNDIIVRSDGMVYFTDPPFGLGTQTSELGYNGVFRVTPAKEISLVEMTMDKPNGIALSPDEKTLYVDDTGKAELWTFTVNADGSTGAGKKFISTSPNPDGMTVDNEGNLYLSTLAGVDVYRSDGTMRGNIPVPEQPSNCAFGGADGKTLYITARKGVYQIKLNIAGKP
jgi:gluconolactonase